MADLIDRQAVQELVDRIGDIYPYRQTGNRESYSQYNEAWTDAINRVDAELNSLPSAERHGKWLHKNSTFKNRWLCSECGYTWYFDTKEASYCPHCGARMDEVT